MYHFANLLIKILCLLYASRSYTTRVDLDTDLEMVTRDEATSRWRKHLPPDCLQQHLIGAGIGSYVNNNKIRLMRELQGNRTKAFAAEKVLAATLLSDIGHTLLNARIALENLPFSTLMLENPKHAIEELSRWIRLYAEAIEVRSHLESRIEAASHSMYWPLAT